MYVIGFDSEDFRLDNRSDEDERSPVVVDEVIVGVAEDEILLTGAKAWRHLATHA